MNFANNPEREQVLDQALDARTLLEIEIATQKIRDWIRRNPDDFGIREILGGLSLMKDIAKEQEAERVLSDQKIVAAR